MHTVTYAIGDIHGRLDLLEDLLGLVEADAEAQGARAKIVFTGDYLDRGADSFGVVERLIRGPRRPGDVFVCLRGNHDDLFNRAVTEGTGLPDWAWQLFWHTIRSYGLERGASGDWRPNAAMRRHAAFLAALPLTHDDGTHLFVHAGIRPGVALADQLEHDLIWIRDEFLHYPGALPRLVVHGHTIMGDRPVVTANRISIDTGAFRSGRLTAAVLDGGAVRFLQAVGAPDRGAIVREAQLHARINGHAVPPETAAAHGAYLDGLIDLAEMTRRTAPAMAD